MSVNTAVTIFAIFDGTTKIKEQDNFPILTESDPAPSGTWGWTVTGSSGFNGTVGFDVVPTGTNTAELQWQNITNAEWLTGDGMEGTVTVVNYSEGESNETTIDISVRRIKYSAFTVFKEQTGSAPLIPTDYISAKHSNYSFMLSSTSTTAPGPSDEWSILPNEDLLQFSNNGAATANPAQISTVSWDQEFRFALVIFDNAVSAARFNNMSMYLRQLTTTSLTLFKGQNDGDDVVATFSGDPLAYALTPNITYPSPGTGATWKQMHDSMTFAFNGAGGLHTTDEGTETVGFAYWGQDESRFHLNIVPSIGTITHPKCVVENMPVLLRNIESTPVRISYATATGTISVSGPSSETWNWQSIADGLGLTNLSIVPTGTITASPQVPATEISGGDYGTATATCQLMSSGTPIAPACTLPIDVSVDIDIRHSGGGIALPVGREKMRYETPLVADSTVESGTTLDIGFDPAAPGWISDVFQIEANPSIAGQYILQTKVGASAADFEYLPDNLAATSPNSIPIKATKIEGTGVDAKVVAQSDVINFSLTATDTKENINATVLLDRSGSMKATPDGSVDSRWDAACSGAGAFANLVAAANALDPTAYKLGIYWFDSGYTPAEITGPINGSSSGAPVTYEITGGHAITAAEHAEADATAMGTGGATALGTGLLNCREELKADPKTDAERVVLVLSDGMENQHPQTPEIFTDGSSTNYWFTDPGGSDAGGDPNVRVYPLALMTNLTATNRLREVVTHTGGIPDVDLTHIENWATPTDLSSNPIGKWFNTMFQNLYGYQFASVAPDPKLKRGHTEIQKVQIHSGQRQVIFYANHNDPAPNDWKLTIEVPGGAATIDKALADATEGIRYTETSYCTMIIANYPLRITGAEHCWSGVWKMKLTRIGRREGHYDMGALVKEEMKFRVDVATQGASAPGKRVWVRASLKDKNGHSITDAKMSGRVTEPTVWMGDKLTSASKRDPKMYMKIKREKNKIALDIDNPADNFLNKLLEKQKAPRYCTKTFQLKHQGKGVYAGWFIPNSPGEHSVDVSCTGFRIAKRPELQDRKKQLVALVKTTAPIAAKKYAEEYAAINQPTAVATRRNTTPRIAARTLSAAALRKYQSAYKKKAINSLVMSLYKKQKYTLEYRGTWTVPFISSLEQSTVFGYMENESTIVLHVEPKDKEGRYLGPGFADQIHFTTPAGYKTKWQSTDMLDGTYEVEIPIKSTKTALRADDTALVASRMALVNPNIRGAVKPKGAALPLKNFAANVCGVVMPITVFALAGNINSKEVHLLSCRYAASMSDENLIWFEDMKDVVAHGYDTCEHCLPLICNMSTKEAHKPTCSHAKRIKKFNRKELSSWTIAKKQGFDGCAHCLPDKHTR